MIRIEIRTAEGGLLACAEHGQEALLCVDRVYQPGDTVIVSGAAHVRAQLDQQLPEGGAVPAGRPHDLAGARRGAPAGLRAGHI